MAENKKEKKSRNLTPEILLNRQINYTILKMLWVLREDKKPMSDFYIETSINRNRYRSIVTNDKARTPRLQETAKHLSEKSGVPIEIYLGKTAFSIKEISIEEWQDYFDEVESVGIAEKKTEKNYAQEQCRQFENKLIPLLKVIPVTQDIDVKLYSAYVYYVYGETINSSEIQVKLNRLVKYMEEITFAQLESLQTNELKEYKFQLDRQVEMISALIIIENKKIYKKRQAEYLFINKINM